MTAQGPIVYPLAPLDHLMPRHHVPKLLYFASTSEPTTIVSALRNAFAKTISAMPIISGSVTPAKYDCQKGSLSVQGPYHTADDMLHVNDLSNDFDYEDIRSKYFPTDAIPADLITPPQSEGPLGVMVAQVNLLKGGLVMYLGVHHCVMDEVGILAIIKVWSACCRGEDGTLLVKPNWFDRSLLPQGAGPGPPQYHSEYIHLPPAETIGPKENSSISNYFPKSSSVASSIFFFSKSSLARLKAAATPSLTLENNKRTPATPIISTNDALCALLWTSITRARLASNPYPATKNPSRFCMTINGRSRLSPPLAPAYTGNVVLISSATSPPPTLLSQPLATTASLIRASIAAVNDTYIRSVIHMIQTVDDVGIFTPRAEPPQQHTLGVSSWARGEYYELSWGKELGVCERVRWRVLRTDGMAVVFPRVPRAHGGRIEEEGGVEVVVGLEGKVMGRLKGDEGFMGFAEWRCD